MTEEILVLNERDGRTADCVTPVRHPMLKGGLSRTNCLDKKNNANKMKEQK